ncbi:enoyl-CoA hydratase/isomerase family protein [Sphingomonas sp. S17]|jgi:enoyl-CoA hydratase/carnithine racemase|uniref:Crotonase/enoyl-CoA hydratase family protein n=2 Tax=Sphingomonas paucimobilis TaxID=13689 RepID=A0A7Y2KUA2_SPHPI|nr:MULTISPECIES: crotonase/enoyl-CoA hydratase family protein [Sphingomonas]EGI53637.1 enoyl-CoA hydratase/isomerase family protein [Sphingomonas sp. S17]MBQ1481652.1 crotonase/enoyl-CoA hydratase family protein [Sphingomonas sp.]MCM3680569.1 crotonase/enoyl-CoA hydratase family protein [Sphingomonas paucimobilis]MDG5970004.1 crotonase/enoyl-CoA hydratase family protein [Sphingomonas paucimobilis]NNG59670.1 crotonase/enoyl-CoA hydratase family protein [Sphingomonas paucimobilis]
MQDRVTIEVTDGVADVRLARGEKLNAIDRAMFDALAEAIATLSDRPDLRAVVLSGKGDGFCSGLDMAAMAGGDLAGLDLSARTHGPANLVQQVAWGWQTLPVPVIAAVHGVAFGGGTQIMGGADIRIAHPATRFAIREVHWGIVPDMGGFALWRGVREDALREWIYTAREFDAAEALAAGFVTRLSEDPRGEALALAGKIAERSPDAVRSAKRLFGTMATTESAAMLAMESAEQVALMQGANHREAVRANMERRRPAFRDA